MIQDGYAIIPDAIPGDEMQRLEAWVGTFDLSDAAGTRTLLGHPDLAAYAASGTPARLAAQALGQPAKPIRGILFDKSSQKNWKVGWHIDRAIAVNQRSELEGYRGWSQKEGVWHVHPPRAVLDQMLAVRIHLDDSTEDNGPLRVVPGSDQWAEPYPEFAELEAQAINCTVPRGGVILMRSVTLHASSKATSDRPRRVVHIEYAACDLPHPLEWAY